METTASSDFAPSCVSPGVKASIAQTTDLADVCCEPAPGFRAAIEQLTDEHVRELSVLHREITQLRKMVTNLTIPEERHPDGCDEASLLECSPEPPKLSWRPEFPLHANARLADRPDDALALVSDQHHMLKDDITRDGGSCGRRASLNYTQTSSDITAQMSQMSEKSPRADFADGCPSVPLCPGVTMSDYVSEDHLFAARNLWTGAGPSLHMKGHGSEKYSLAIKESVASSAHSHEPVRCTDFCIILPTSSISGCWVSLTTMALAYDLYLIPLALSFELPANDITYVGNWVTRLLWSMDIPMSFCTAYYLPDQESLERSHIRIGLRYMKTWFLLDAGLVFIDWYLSMSGFDNKVSRVGRIGKFARFLRFLRMLRLLRAARLGHFLERMLESIANEAARLRFITLKIILMMLWLNHFLACGWHLVGSWEVNDHPGWTLRVPAVTSVFEAYSASMQWALTNFGVGSTRLSPETSAENSFSFFTMLFSLLIFATLLSTIANGYARMQAARSDEMANMSELRMYLAQNNVHKELCGRVIRQAKVTMKLKRNKLHMESVALLKSLSPTLNSELRFVVFGKYVVVSSVFRGLLKVNRDLVFTLSNEAMKDVHTPGGDVIFYRGQTATHMVLLPMDSFHGTAKYVGKYHARYMSPGCWICEACLWLPWIHVGSLKVSEACEQVQMNAEKFGKVIYDHPEYWDSMRDLAVMFVSSLNEAVLGEDVDERRETLELYDTHAHVDWKGYLRGVPGVVQLNRGVSAKRAPLRTDIPLIATSNFSAAASSPQPISQSSAQNLFSHSSAQNLISQSSGRNP